MSWRRLVVVLVVEVVTGLVGHSGVGQRRELHRGSRRRPSLRMSLPEMELWLDLRTTFRDPETALRELYVGVQAEITKSSQTLPSGQAVSGVILWRDPEAEMPAGLGDLPIVAVDPRPRNATLTGLATAPASSPSVGSRPISVLEPPFDSSEAVAALDRASCVVVDGARPDYWQDDTLPLVELLAAASMGRARLLVSLFDPPQLSACAQALVLGGLAGAAVPKLDGLGCSASNDQDDWAADGLGVALPPDPRLWSHAVMYKS